MATKAELVNEIELRKQHIDTLNQQKLELQERVSKSKDEYNKATVAVDRLHTIREIIEVELDVRHSTTAVPQTQWNPSGEEMTGPDSEEIRLLRYIYRLTEGY
jgi:hypothetical protein